MKNKNCISKLSIVPLSMLLIFLLQGCAGTQTFSNNVLAGETAVVAAGYQHYFSQDNVTVTFTPEVGDSVVYAPGDAAIRGIVNLYPDPLSSIVLSHQVGQNISSFSNTYSFITGSYTDSNKEWWQTTLYIDTPSTLPVGVTTITITNPEGESAESVVNITGVGGLPDKFSAQGAGALTRIMFESLERVDHYAVEFNGATIPDAIQVDLAATTLLTYIKKGNSERASLHWNKTGDDYKVIMLSNSQGSATEMSDFNFYVPIASGVTGETALTLAEPVLAFDSNGEPVTGVTVEIKLVKGVAGLSSL